MRSYYHRRSLLGVLVRWTLVFGALYVLFAVVAWAFTDLIPDLAPQAVVSALAAGAQWLATRAEG